MKSLAPIVLFTYCRADVTKQTVQSLLANSEAKDSVIYIYSDNFKNEKFREGVEETRRFIRSINGFKEVIVIEREENWGLSQNLIDGITTVVDRHGKVIVLEDDTVVSKHFLKFMNEALSKYENDNRIASVSGYNYGINNLPECYFSKIGSCWGWATWKRAWQYFNYNAVSLLIDAFSYEILQEHKFFHAFLHQNPIIFF